MRLTPLDIRKQEFRKGMRGLDADEVYAFLSTVADEYEAVINDNKALRERLLELDDKVQEYRNMEKTLRDTLLTAERVTVEAKENARRESDLIVKEAQIEAEKAVRDIRTTSMKIRQEIQELRQQRDSYLSRMKILVDSHMRFVDAAEKEFAEEERELNQKQNETNQPQSQRETTPAPPEPALNASRVAELITAIEPEPNDVGEIPDRAIEPQKTGKKPATDLRATTMSASVAPAGAAPANVRAAEPTTGDTAVTNMPPAGNSSAVPPAGRGADGIPPRSIETRPAYQNEETPIAAARRAAAAAADDASETVSATAPGASDAPGEWSLEKLKRDILGGSKPDHENG